MRPCEEAVWLTQQSRFDREIASLAMTFVCEP